MNDLVLQGLEVLARGLETIGAGILVLGFVIATMRWFREAFHDASGPAGERYRRALGRVVLIGLELLVAATIVRTITVDPSVEGMGLLVFMVAIRTILGWTTFLEMNGRWPWQRSRTDTANSETTS